MLERQRCRQHRPLDKRSQLALRQPGDEHIRVVNLSLGTPAVESWRNDPLCRAVRQLTAAGMVVVAAAGNNGKTSAGQKIYGAIHSPGNDPTVITVGAANTFGTDARNDDGVTTYSSRRAERVRTGSTMRHETL